MATSSLHTGSNTNHDNRTSHNYRMPLTHPKRSNPTESYPAFRSPSPKPIIRTTRRRHSTPHLSTVRFYEQKTPPMNRRIRQYHPEIRSIAASRDRINKTHRRSRSLIKRPHPDDSMLHLASSMTNMNSASSISKQNLRSIAETSTSEVLSLDPDLWTRQHQQNRLEDGYLSDQETWSETSYKVLAHESCIGCHRLFNCSCCEYYYNCPFCCWILYLFLAIVIVVAISLIIAFLPT